MFETPQHLYDKADIERAAQHDLDLAVQVEAVLKSPGWKLFTALVRKKEIEILRHDCPDFQTYKAERAGLKFLKDTIDEFTAYRDTGDAVQMLNELHKGEETLTLPIEEQTEEN